MALPSIAAGPIGAPRAFHGNIPPPDFRRPGPGVILLAEAGDRHAARLVAQHNALQAAVARDPLLRGLAGRVLLGAPEPQAHEPMEIDDEEGAGALDAPREGFRFPRRF